MDKKRASRLRLISFILSFHSSELNNNLNSHPQFIYDDEGRITGYKTKAGADTVFPFSRDVEQVYKSGWVTTKTYKHTYTADEDGQYIIFMHCSSATGNSTYKLNVSNAEALLNTSHWRGACAVYLANLKKNESIDLSYSTSDNSAYSFNCVILRC